jgi:hypothetical protein
MALENSSASAYYKDNNYSKEIPMAEAKQTKPEKPTTPTEPAAKAETPATAPAASTTPKKDSNKKVLIIVLAVVGVFIVLPMIAMIILGSVIGHKLTNNGTVKVSGDKGSVSIKGKDGNEFTAGTTATLPKDFPQDVDVYNDNIQSSSKISENGKTVWTVSVTTADSPTKVGQVLTESYTTDGWTASLNNNGPDSGLMIAKKGDLQVNVYYAAKDGKTTIVYTVGKSLSSEQ